MFAPGDVEYLPPSGGRLGADATTLTPGALSSPEDLLNAAKQTNAVVMALHNAIDANRKSKHVTVSKATRDEWVAFVLGWSGYYETNFSSRFRVFTHWGTSNLQGSLVNYQQQVNQWVTKLKKVGIDITGAVPEGATGGAKSVMMWVGIAAVSLVGLFIIGKLVHTVALGGAELEEAEDEAMKIAESKRRKKHDRSVLSIT